MPLVPWLLATATVITSVFFGGIPWPWDISRTQVGRGCLAKLYYMQAGKNDNPYTLPMLFASGKDLPNDAGKYDLCLRIPTARYFLVSLVLSKVKVSFPGLGINGALPMELGLCLPDVCTPKDISQLLTEVWAEDPPFPLPRKLKQMKDFGHLTVKSVTSPDVDWQSPTASTYIAAALIFTLIVAVCFSTAIHEYAERRLMALVQEEFRGSTTEGAALVRAVDQERYRHWQKSRFVSALSLKITWRKLMAPSPEPAKATDHLNGMRVISMGWIILGHTFLMANAIAGYDNPEEVVARKDGRSTDISFQFVIGGHAAVDSFFYMSGFLLAYLTLRGMRRKAKHLDIKSILHAIFFRYLRLTPSLAFVLLFYYRISMYLGNGPFFARYQNSVTRRCDDTWMTELLYTMNFWPWDPDMVCMGWTWYLGCDFIFFILSLVILGIYGIHRRLGWLLVVTFFIASAVYTAKDVWVHRLGVYLFDGVYEQYSYHAYSRPWNRFGGYLVGVAAALFYTELSEKKNGTLSAAPLLLLNLLALALMLYVVIIPWTTYKWPNSWTRWQNVAYISMARSAWALGISVVSLSCLSCSVPRGTDCISVKSDTDLVLVHDSWVTNLRYNPLLLIELVNQMLSAYIWVPLARLTYSTYLVHPIVVKLLAANSYSCYHFSYTGILERTAANCVLSYALAFVIYALVERPVLTLTSDLQK